MYHLELDFSHQTTLELLHVESWQRSTVKVEK